MKTRKILAFGMATMLTLSSTVMAFAADVTDPSNASGTIPGTGSLEGYIDKHVFTVTLPTTTSVDFKLDPQELMKATSSTAKLDGAAFADGYGDKVLFKKDSTDFISKSNDITVINKSTFDVDVEVNAKLTGLTKDGDDSYNIKVMDPTADGFAFGTDTAITMALTPSTNTITNTTEGTAVAGTATYLTDAADGVTVTQKVEKAANVDNAYKVSKEASGYSYAFDTTAAQAVPFNEVVFNLSGTVNKAADWTNFSKDTTAALAVQVTYTVKEHEDMPVFDGTADVSIPVDETTVTSIKLTGADGTSATLSTNASIWSYASGAVTFKATWLNSAKVKDGWGTGEYTLTIGSSNYKFKVQ